MYKSVIRITLSVVLAATSFYAGKKSVHHVLVLNPNTGGFSPLELKADTKIYVASPDGLQPGVLAAKTKDGKIIVLLPPSLLDSVQKPDESQAPAPPENQTKHEPEQSGGERLDTTSL